MRIVCNTIIDDPKKRDNLCQCIEILGAEYDVSGTTVYADFTGEEDTAKKLMDLFRQYKTYGISILA